jgi:hypothetical protein
MIEIGNYNDKNGKLPDKNVDEDVIDPWAINVKESDDGPEWEGILHFNILMNIHFYALFLFSLICK